MREYGRPAITEQVRRAAAPGSWQRSHGTQLADVLPLLRDTLVAIADQAMHAMIVTDAQGKVLWRAGRRDVRAPHRWTRAACPIHDPGSGSMVGAVDVSGPELAFHPTTIELVAAAAQLAEGHLAVREMVAGLTTR